jgi:ABC-type multidrug transport system ATPase subunit
MIKTDGLSKYYGKGGEIKAVDDLSLIVYEGETFGLLGPNGARAQTIYLNIHTNQQTNEQIQARAIYFPYNEGAQAFSSARCGLYLSQSPDIPLMPISQIQRQRILQLL